MPEDLLRVNARELLHFLDEVPEDSRGHATSLVAVFGEDLAAALVEHSWREQGAETHVSPESVTQGTPKGHRLDRWISVRTAGETSLYQTEIKMWSGHAIGGRALPSSVSPEQLAQHGLRNWQGLWSDEQGLLVDTTRKVLTPMKPPTRLMADLQAQGFSGPELKPLLCLWMSVQPSVQPGNQSDAWFSVPVVNGAFPRLYVFSVSNYLRRLKEQALELALPETSQRLRWLQRFFPDRG